ncbi:MAG: HAMP domain-containing sensor histidine kinase, partial [Christensenella sp.]|uniref:sensor histidine kinase n=1 Tax=Christensenella sp. TaxID=1935934 RepID=UPI002B1FFE18
KALKKISLRMRLTLFTVALLAGVSVVFTLSTIYNAQFSYVEPYISSMKVNTIPIMENYYDEGYRVVPNPANDIADINMSDGAISTSPAAAVSVMATATTQFNSMSLWIMLAIIGGGGFLTYLLLGRALKPVRDLSTEIEGITEHELSQRVGSSTARDEISSLAHSFNTMLARLDKAFSDQKRFSSDAAHELKTPLAAIKTNIDVLQLSDDPTTDEYKQTVDVVKKQTERMVRLVDDLFTISSQRCYDFNDPIDFDSMFADITAQLSPRIAEKGLCATVEPGGLATTGNSVMLMRAFSNLVENAVKYNVQGGNIDIASFARDKDYIFTIADTGIGIPAEKREHIFDPFFRADDSRSRKIGGAGLGLAIAKDIIERHGGMLAVASGENGGTVFTVTLPRLSAE